jgi:hypothetical protein
MSDMKRDPAEHAAEGIHPAAKPFLFLGKDTVKANFMWLPLIGIVITVIFGLMHPLKHPAPWDFVPGSWAIFGFIAYTLIVLSAPFLFKVLARNEDYYGEGGLPDPDYSTEHEGEH